MAFYAHDRLGNFGLSFTSEIKALSLPIPNATAAPATSSLMTQAYSQPVPLTLPPSAIAPTASVSSALMSVPAPEVSSAPIASAAAMDLAPSSVPFRSLFLNLAPAPQVQVRLSPQQQADAELAELQRQQDEIETAAAEQQALDLGVPQTPWLLYGGLGVGALVLLGGVLFATRKKGKVSGYRRRKRRR